MDPFFTLTVISKELSSDYRVSLRTSDQAPIEKVLLWEEKAPYSDDEAVYLCHFSQSLNKSVSHLPANLILLCDPPPGDDPPPPPGAQNVLFVAMKPGGPTPTTETIRQAVDDHLRTYRAQMRWRYQITNELLSNHSMQAIINSATSFFGNPLLVQDCSFKLLTHSQNQKVDEWIWKQITDLKSTPYDVIRHIRTNDFAKVYSTETPVFIPKDDYIPNDTLSCRIDVLGKAVGHVSLIGYSKPIRHDMVEPLYYLSRILSQYFQQRDFRQITRGVIYESFLIDLLDGRSLSRSTVENRMSTLALAPMEKMCLITLKSIAQANHQLPILFMRDLLQSELPTSKTVLYNDDIVLLLSGGSSDVFLPPEKVESIRRLLFDNELICGVSICFSDITQTSVYYQQTLRAMEIGASIHGGERTLFFYEDYLVYQAIDLAARNPGQSLALCSPCLLEFMENEEQKSIHGMETLYVWLSANGNLAASAAILRLHRNTIEYRVRRIRELFPKTLDDPDFVFQLLFSYRILIRNHLFTPPGHIQKSE